MAKAAGDGLMGLAFLLCVVLLIPGCELLTGAEGDDEAFRMEIFTSEGYLLASVDRTRQVSGGIFPFPGQEQAIHVYFSDSTGDRVPIESSEFGYSISWAIGNEGIVEIEPAGGHHVLTGKAVGSTQVIFKLLRGGDREYESPPITVSVSHLILL